jgi:hypothetical protein
MGYSVNAAHDPSAPAGHLPGFAREERFMDEVSPSAWN